MRKLLTYFFRYQGRIGRVQFIASVILWTAAAAAIALGYRSMFGDLRRSESDIIVMADTITGAVGVVICFATFFSPWVKRCHDLGKSGLFALLFFIPLANSFLLLFLLFKKGDTEPNAWGKEPEIFEL
jgi:uncharacterized membrane protein YhaH (DUF805 family)